MADIVTPEVRSRMMSRIRGRNTRPEVVLRKALHCRGFRFRLNAKKLPGSPDIVLPRWKTVLFVHGCYWHRHPGCRKATTPSSNVEFWAKKFRQNVEREARNIREAAFLPVEIADAVPVPFSSDLQVSTRSLTEPVSAQRIDITLSDGRRILVEGTTSLSAVLSLVEGLMP